MAAKKKPAKKRTTSKKTAVKKAAPQKKTAKKKLPVKAKKVAKKPVLAKKQAKKKASAKAVGAPKKQLRKGPQSASSPSSREGVRVISGLQAGDFQGLSNDERADSESVDELLDEGNSFEAGVVSGVEEADNADEQEVHTHEVPEDDVPEEYLEKDQ
jgi:hypothetical protein